MSNNELDKFLKDKLEEQSFEYNPSDWEAALELIEKEDKKRRPLWIWIAAAGIAFLLSAGAISMLTNDPISTDQVVAHDTQVQSTENQVKDAETQTNDKSDNSNNKNIQIEEALVSQVEQSTTNGSDKVTVQKEVIPKITSPKTGSINLPDPISGDNPKLQPISSPVSESVADVRAGEDFSSIAAENAEVEETVSEVLSLDKSYDASTVWLLTDLNRVTENLYQPMPFSWETPKQPERIERADQPEVKLGFGYGASAYVNPYVANLDGQSKQITGFSGGISTLYRLDRTLSLNADLLYTYRTGTFDKSDLSETRRYSFEALDGISSLNPKALHYLSLPVYAGLHFGKHRVTFGGSLNYLGAVRGDVLDQTVNSAGEVIKESTESGWIAKDGFTTFNIGGMIGYDFALTNHWNLSFRSNYLFTNIVDKSISERINSVIVKENSQVNIQLGTTYYFR